MLRDYGNYEALFNNKNLHAAIRILNRVSKRLCVPYAVIGGSATYLHTHNPPEDFADLDIMLDADKEGGLAFASAVSKNGFRIIMLDDAPDLTDMFAITKYKDIQVDIFTNQDERTDIRGALSIRGIPVKRVEPLIVEKLIRASYEDLLMVVDLLVNAEYSRSLVFEAIGKHGRMLLLKLIHVADQVKNNRWSILRSRNAIRRISEGEGL